jgi:hypothetical protein
MHYSPALPRAFAWVLFAQATLFCASIMALASGGWELQESFFYVGAGLFVLSCIALRVAVTLTSGTFTALVLCAYTVGLTLMGCQFAGWLFGIGADEEEEAADPGGGQRAVYLGCLTFLVALVWGQFALQAGEEPRAVTTQSALLILFTSGLALVSIDDRVWDWRYAYGILFSVAGSTYLLLNTEPHVKLEDSPQKTCALIILQPILFVEDWLIACLLA